MPLLKTTLFKSLLVALCMMLSKHKAMAIIDFNANITKIYDELFNLKFEKATQLIEIEKRNNPTNAAVVGCEGTLAFYKCYLSESQHDFYQMKNKFDTQIERLQAEANDSPFKLYLQAELTLQMGLVRAMHNEYINAAVDIRKSYKLYAANAVAFKQFKPNLKGMGFLHILIGAIPENYKWAANLIGLKGTIKQGTDELTELISYCVQTNQYDFIKNESLLFLIYVQVHYGKDIPRAMQLIKLYDANYTSPFINYSIANVYSIAGKNEIMLHELESFEPDMETAPLHYLQYLKGICKSNRLDFSAIDNYKKFIKTYPGYKFKKSAYQRIAWLYLIKGDTAQYHHNIKQVIHVGSSFTDEDKQAQAEAEQKILPNVVLLKARLLFDGGFYLKSLSQLAHKTNSDQLKDKIEGVYRTARNFDMLEQNEKAITFYINTIAIGEKTSYYFAASAALCLAQLYESQHDVANAKHYYTKCLSMRSHDYQNSIDQKAKAGLNRLGTLN